MVTVSSNPNHLFYSRKFKVTPLSDQTIKNTSKHCAMNMFLIKIIKKLLVIFANRIHS